MQAAAAAAALTLTVFFSLDCLCDHQHTHNYTDAHNYTHNHTDTHNHSNTNKQQQSNETAPQKKKNQPHIIFILTDDQGFNDIGYHNPTIKTPTLDKLAAEGVTLENYYVQPICTPSRSQLLTGRYQIHTGLQHSIIRPSQPSCLPPNMDTLPQRLREAGYSTHMVGKWHLGFYRKSCLPTRKGFDSFFGSLTGSVDYYSYGSCDGPGVCGYDLHEHEGVAWGQEGKYSTTLFTQRARKILESHAPNDRPLFLLLSLQAVHTPLTPPKPYIYPYRHMANVARRKFAGMVSTVDEAVRNVTYALRKYGYYKNSVIIYSTDNGAQPFTGGSNWPLRGRKGTYWEGGVRGVGFVHSPLLRRRRRVCKALLHITDWFPTLVGLAGGNLSQSRGLDGFDVWPSISEGKESPRQEILHNIDPLHKPPAQTMKWESHSENLHTDGSSKAQKIKKPKKKKILRLKPNQKSAFKLKRTKKPKTFPQHLNKSKPQKSKPVPRLKAKPLPKSKPIPRSGTKDLPQSSLKSSRPPPAAGTESEAQPQLQSALTPKSRRTTSQKQNSSQSTGSAKSRTQELKLHVKSKSRRTVPRHLNESWSPPAPGPTLQVPQSVWDTSVQAAIRVGDWKLLTGDPGHGDWVPPQVLPTLPGRWWNLERTFPTRLHKSTLHKNIWLFNITDDPYERHDQAASRPEVVLQLLRRLAHYNHTAVPVYFPADDPRANPELHSGAWVPWLEEGEGEGGEVGGAEGGGEGEYDYKKGKNSKKKRKKKSKKCRLCKLQSFFLKLNTRMMSNRI